MHIAHKKAKEIVFVQIFFIFLLPILLLYFNIVSNSFRVMLLVFSSLLIFAIVRNEKWSIKKLGWRIDNIRSGIFAYSLYTIIGCLFLLYLSHHFKTDEVENWWTQPHFLFLFIVVSFFQEFAYRAFLLPQLKKIIKSPLIVIILNSILFMFLHIIYPGPAIMLPLAFLGGLWFASIYYFYPNLILATISHSVLNFVAVLLGFFAIYPGHY